LSTRDENTIRELERTYHHRLTTDGFMYFFEISVSHRDFKNMHPEFWDQIKKVAPEMLRKFVLQRMRGET
jgi:hypothetical protein